MFFFLVPPKHHVLYLKGSVYLQTVLIRRKNYGSGSEHPMPWDGFDRGQPGRFQKHWGNRDISCAKNQSGRVHMSEPFF